MTPAQISKELERFKADVNKKVQDQKTARYIIATSSAFSVGLTLSEAISVGFLEPDYRATTMIQGLSRHCRQGNKNPQVCSWIFRAKGSTVEERICQVNRLRSCITKAAARTSNSVEGGDLAVAGQGQGSRAEVTDEDDIYEV